MMLQMISKESVPAAKKENNMANTKERRRRYLINKRMQLQFVRILVMQAAIPIVILGLSLYFINKMYLLRLQAIVGSSVMSDAEVQSILNFSILSLLSLLVVACLLLAFLAIRFSHQIAGPLYKLETSMDKLNRGEKVELVYFRKTDLLNGLGDKLNAIAKKLGQVK